jgi:histone H3/H4
MPRKGNILPKAPLARIMKDNGAKRISDGALETLSNKLQDFAEDISKRSIRIANHSGRKTVHESDLKLALK